MYIGFPNTNGSIVYSVCNVYMHHYCYLGIPTKEGIHHSSESNDADFDGLLADADSAEGIGDRDAV